VRGRSRTSSVDSETQDLFEHFEARQQYEAKDFSRFDTAGIIRYREDKKRFIGERYESLYTVWLSGGPAGVAEVLYPGQGFKTIPVQRFSDYVLEHDYDLFGTLASRSRNRIESAPVPTQI
jgi:hypothetical protein